MTSQKKCVCKEGECCRYCTAEEKHGLQPGAAKQRIDAQCCGSCPAGCAIPHKPVPPAVGEFAVQELVSLRARLAKYEDAEGNPKALPSGVVLPERWSVPRPIWKDVRQPYGDPLNQADIEAAEKFNLALDEVARLNSPPVSAGEPDDQAYDAEAERLTAEALGVGAGVNPNATSVDDIFLTESAGGVDERAVFELRFPPPKEAKWDEEDQRYYVDVYPGEAFDDYGALFEGWQARAALTASAPIARPLLYDVEDDTSKAGTLCEWNDVILPDAFVCGAGSHFHAPSGISVIVPTGKQITIRIFEVKHGK